jgi:trehalose 6-phosphate phosphatase
VAPLDPRDLPRHADSAGIFLDFDGTLSDIAPTPEEARPLEGAEALLRELAGRYRLVAVISGRPASQVAALVGAPVRIFGLYGLEDERGTSPDARTLTEAVAEAIPDIERAAALVPGARVERKGLSAAVHYRSASDAELARRVLLERLGAIAERRRLEVLEGKRVVELAGTPRPSKGHVVRKVVREENLGYGLFAGDDLADLEAFAAIDELVGTGFQAIKVAVRSLETPDALMERADLTVEGPSGLLELLRNLAAG